MDLVWQRQFLYRLDDTQQRYAGKSWSERQLAASDGGLFWFVRQVKTRLPEASSVVHLITDNSSDRDRYIRYRSQYHLRPHNVNAEMPALQIIQPGDYILMIGALPGLRYAEDGRMLIWQRRFRIQVEPVFESQHGVLYKVDG